MEEQKLAGIFRYMVLADYAYVGDGTIVDLNGNPLADRATSAVSVGVITPNDDTIRLLNGPGSTSFVAYDDAHEVLNADSGGFLFDFSGVGFSATFVGGNFGDRLRGGTAEDTLRGGAGDDRLEGGGGNDRLEGGAGEDTLIGGKGADLMIGGLDGDTYYVDDINDRVIEGADGGVNDVIRSLVSYSLVGRYVELLDLTGTANISATGNSLANRIEGNSGDNVLNGGRGDDTLTGGGGNDTFSFITRRGSFGDIDKITDFSNESGNDDKIKISKEVFSAITETGELDAALFKANDSGVATELDDRIIYSTNSGQLFYDGNGSGPGGGIPFAVIANHASLTGGSALTAADFIVV